MRPQEAQHINLDEAIDHVAARLTHVDDDPTLATRIIETLPQHVTGFAWLFHSWALRLAVLAVIVTGGVLWRIEPVTPIEPAPLQAVAVPPPFTTFAAAVEPEPNRTRPLEPLEPLAPLEPFGPSKSDFDRSLAAIAAPEALAIEPLAITDLLLTADFSPR